MRCPALVLLILIGASVSGQAPRLEVDPDSLLPWTLARATIRAEAGLPAELRVVGTSWNEEAAILFQGRSTSYATAMEAAFFLDGDRRSLRLESRREGGPWEVEGEVTLPAAPASLVPPLPPLHRPGMAAGAPGPARAAVPPAAGAIVDRGGLLSSRLPLGTCAALLILILTFSLAGLPAAAKLLKRWRGMAAALLLSIALLCLAVVLLPPAGEAFSLELAGGGEVGQTLDAREAVSEGIRHLSWGREGGPALLAFRSAPGRPLPLEVVEGGGGLFRFDSNPLVLNEGGRLLVSFPRLSAGWRIRGLP